MILLANNYPMTTILVPTDFSEIAANAAAYAFKLASDLQTKKVVFYNAYQAPPILTENTVPAMPLMDIETLKDISEEGMKAFLEKMRNECPVGIEIEKKTGFSILSNDINELCEEVGAELIVMGITGTSKIEEVLVGSTALSVMKQTTVPVIIVPAGARYSTIRNVMLACDFKNVVETTPVEPLKKLLNATKAALHIVNVQENHKQISEEVARQQQLLHDLLRDYNPRFYFENNEHFIDGINYFVDTHSIDIIIAIPRKHKLFEGLFKERHTKKLAFHSHVPLMYIHQEDL
jgi:nucleotide-binding universal stress UspA family protein